MAFPLIEWSEFDYNILVDEIEISMYSIFLAALFLKSQSYPCALHPGETERVLKIMTASSPSKSDVLSNFIRNGYWEASMRLSMPGILSWARDLFESGSVITVVDPSYPSRLRTLRGVCACPALWKVGPMPSRRGASVGGSENPPSVLAEFACQAGEAVARAGHTLITGGHSSSERLAEEAALKVGGSVLRFIPTGISWAIHEPGVCQLSQVDPSEPYSAAAAIASRALVYACSTRSLVAHARFREGETWFGVQDAIRRRLTNFFVPHTGDERWSKALISLGAQELLEPGDFMKSLADVES